MEEVNSTSYKSTDYNSDNDKAVNRFQSDLRENELPNSVFSVQIVNYKKTSSFLETFIVYTIQTSGDFRPYSVERRYNDFQWLHHRLIERYPMAIMPPLPVKHNLTAIERFSGLFIEQRRNALDKFLQRLTSHHLIGVDKEYWLFLTLLPTMFQEYRREHPSLGKIESLLQSIHNLPAIGAVVTDSIATATATITSDSHFGKLADDSVRSAHVMGSLGRLVRRSGDVWHDLSRLCLDDTIPDSDPRWKVLMEVGEHCLETSQCVRHKLEPWVTENELYWIQVEQVAKRRNAVESRFLASLAKQARAQESPERVEHARQVTNTLHDNVSKSNADLTSELECWRAQCAAETGDWMKKFTEMHVDHYRKTGAIWRQLVTALTESAPSY